MKRCRRKRKTKKRRPTVAHNIILICNNYLHYNELHSPCFIDDDGHGGREEKPVERKNEKCLEGNQMNTRKCIRGWRRKQSKKFCLWKNVIMLKRRTSLGARVSEKAAVLVNLCVVGNFVGKFKWKKNRKLLGVIKKFCSQLYVEWNFLNHSRRPRFRKCWEILENCLLAPFGLYPEKQENDKKAFQRKVKRARKFYVAGREKNKSFTLA